jgi:hypothetical protein
MNYYICFELIYNIYLYNIILVSNLLVVFLFRWLFFLSFCNWISLPLLFFFFFLMVFLLCYERGNELWSRDRIWIWHCHWLWCTEWLFLAGRMCFGPTIKVKNSRPFGSLRTRAQLCSWQQFLDLRFVYSLKWFN